MTEWFKEYFQLASQGVDGDKNYDERPVTLTYKGATGNIAVDEGKSESKWLVYPISFPSYKRSNENFAPEWQVECEVYEAPLALRQVEKDAAIERLKRSSLYTPMNKYSDPLAQFLPDNFLSKNAKIRNKLIDDALAKASQRFDEVIDFYNEMIPSLDKEDIRYLLMQGGSLVNDIKADRADDKKKKNDRLKENDSVGTDRLFGV
ncbi:MAG: hypothetical protein H0X02_11340 [Nitrosomonas sp.]|nr:hypothetical protein [Nitrosomonas sp.]